MLFIKSILLVSSCFGLLKCDFQHRKRHKAYRNDKILDDSILIDQQTPQVDHSQISSDYGKPCITLSCGAGRVCEVDQQGYEKCICAGESYCAKGHRMVCGSDGNMYDSHCELHRTACLTNTKIFADRNGEACFQKDLLYAKIKSLGASKTLSMKKDLSMKQSDNSNPRAVNAGDSIEDSNTLKSLCSASNLAEFKDLLLMYHCNRLALSHCSNLELSIRKYVIKSMFKYYDQNLDQLVGASELSQSQRADHMEQMSEICSLNDLLKSSATRHLDLANFSYLFGIYHMEDLSSVVTLESNTKVITVVADGYEGVELSCSLEDFMNIQWTRNGHVIDFEETSGFSLMGKSQLYISAVSLDHTGNYTCRYVDEPETFQRLQLIVQVKPVVRTKYVGKVLEGLTTPLRCHSDGVPEPVSEWQVSQYKLPNDRMRYDFSNDNSTVYILSPSTDLDNAEYECIGKSDSGWIVSKTEVIVESKSQFTADEDKPSKGQYVVFHAKGYTAYEAEHCYTTHSVGKQASDFVTSLGGVDTLYRLCPRLESCSWGDAVSIDNKVIYVTQPKLKRIVAVDLLNNFRPKHVIVLEHPISSIQYLPSNNELWILSGNQPQFQSIDVLENANNLDSSKVHSLQPEHTIFDTIESLFVPPKNSFNHSLRYVYTTKYAQMSLNRIDIVSMSAKGHLDLTNWNCRPKELHYLAIGGLAILTCSAERSDDGINLLLDTVTNRVIQKLEPGKVYVSPNTRYIVLAKQPNKISVYNLLDNATLIHMYGHRIEIPINHITFMDSKRSAGYDLAISSSDENSELFLDLKTMQTDVLEGLLSGRANTTRTKDVTQLTATSGEFGYHIMLPSQGALFIVNKQYHLIACEWTDVVQAQTAVWTDV